MEEGKMTTVIKRECVNNCGDFAIMTNPNDTVTIPRREYKELCERSTKLNMAKSLLDYEPHNFINSENLRLIIGARRVEEREANPID